MNLSSVKIGVALRPWGLAAQSLRSRNTAQILRDLPCLRVHSGRCPYLSIELNHGVAEKSCGHYLGVHEVLLLYRSKIYPNECKLQKHLLEVEEINKILYGNFI